jgi:hypothetical protein
MINNDNEMDDKLKLSIKVEKSLAKHKVNNTKMSLVEMNRLKTS